MTKAKKILFFALLLSLFLLAFVLRTGGLFRGLEADYIYHPDEPKQVVALNNFLNDTYVWYVGNPFYDGYPYGLNHIDEWLLRPVFSMVEMFHNHIIPDTEYQKPSIHSLYYWARSLRVLYGLIALLLTYFIAKRLFQSRSGRLLSVLFLALSPISIVVAHFASGDIGSDLFSGQCCCSCAFTPRKDARYTSSLRQLLWESHSHANTTACLRD